MRCFFCLPMMLILGACGGGQDIADLRMPTPSVIDARVVRMESDTMLLVKDDHGDELRVDLTYIAFGTPRLFPNEEVTIKGFLNMQGNFDPLQITREDGTVVKAVVGRQS